MKKPVVICIVMLLLLSSFIVYMVYNDEQSKKAEEQRQESYQYTIRYISNNHDAFEKMCEYELDHYSERISGSGAFLVPKSGEPYNDERKMIFYELGLYYQGFSEGVIHPEEGTIEFGQSGVYWVRLIYSREGVIPEGESFDIINEHFYIKYFKVSQPSG